MCSVQYVARGGDGSALGGARVSGGCSAAVGGGVAEAVAVLFTLGCRLPEPGGGNCNPRSARDPHLNREEIIARFREAPRRRGASQTFVWIFIRVMLGRR